MHKALRPGGANHLTFPGAISELMKQVTKVFMDDTPECQLDISSLLKIYDKQHVSAATWVSYSYPI